MRTVSDFQILIHSNLGWKKLRFMEEPGLPKLSGSPKFHFLGFLLIFPNILPVLHYELYNLLFTLSH